jgi:hypothetical protein
LHKMSSHATCALVIHVLCEQCSFERENKNVGKSESGKNSWWFGLKFNHKPIFSI